MTEATNHMEATLVSVVDSAATELLQYTSSGAADASLTLSDVAENNSILSQFLADTGNTETDMDCIDKMIEEIDPDKFIDTDFSAALSVADDEDGSKQVETGCSEEQCKATLLSSFSGSLMDTGDAADGQQFESLVDLDAEDIIAVVSNDITDVTEVVSDDVVAYKCAEDDSEPVELSPVQAFPSNSHDVAIITASVSESSNEQQLQQDLTDVIDADRSPLSVMDGMNTSLMGTGFNSAESVDHGMKGTSLEEDRSIFQTYGVQANIKEDDLLESSFVTDPRGDTAQKSDSSIPELVKHTHAICSFSSLVHHSTEVESVDIHLPENDHLLKPGYDSDASVTSNAKEILLEEDRVSEENHNIFPTNDVTESLSLTDSQVDTGQKSVSPSRTPELVEHFDDVHSVSVSLDHHDSEVENVGIHSLPKDNNLLKPYSDSKPSVACNMKETLSQEDHVSKENRNSLTTNDIPVNMQQECGLLESSLGVDTAKSVGPSHSCELIDHTVDIQTSRSFNHCSSEAENTGIHFLPKHDSLKPHKESEVSLACSMEETSSMVDPNILSVNELQSVTVDTTKSDRPSHASQLVECVQCESTVESVQLLSSVGECLNAVITTIDTVDPCESAAHSGTVVLDLSCDEILDTPTPLERSTTETDAVITEDENNDAESSDVSEVNVTASNSGDLCKEDVVLSPGSEVISEPVSSSSSVTLVFNTGLPASTAINHDTNTVDVGSGKDTDESTVIILKDASSSTQPSTTSVPHSSSAVLSNIIHCITSGTANSVSSYVEDMPTLQFPDFMMRPAVEPKSTCTTTTYRPAAALAMSIGKNLVTESILHEVVSQEHKWKDGSCEEKVPICNIYIYKQVAAVLIVKDLESSQSLRCCCHLPNNW